MVIRWVAFFVLIFFLIFYGLPSLRSGILEWGASTNSKTSGFAIYLSDCRHFVPASLSGGLQPVQKPMASPFIYRIAVTSFRHP
jgi:hypothetical protein